MPHRAVERSGATSEHRNFGLMRTPGVEPGPLAGQDPKSCASASFATFAWLNYNDLAASEVSSVPSAVLFVL